MEPETQDVQEVQETPEATEEKAEQPEYTDREKQLYERAKKAEAEAKELREAKPEIKEEPTLETPKPDEISVDDKVDLRLKGYTKEDIDFISKNLNGREIEEALKDPYVQAALAGTKASQEATDTTAEPSTTVPTFTAENKTWANMSEAERKANYQQALGTIRGGSGSQAE